MPRWAQNSMRHAIESGRTFTKGAERRSSSTRRLSLVLKRPRRSLCWLSTGSRRIYQRQKFSAGDLKCSLTDSFVPNRVATRAWFESRLPELVPNRDRFARDTWIPKFQTVLLPRAVRDLAA